MPKSIRIRTEPGVDRNINIKIDQDFDSLEILSLKLRQEDLYTQFCADYGVVVGRVIANGGLGIPNAHISIFIPLDSVDEEDPIISTLYPYKTPTTKNEDGYRYNLLPYEDEYYGHNATGTFPTVDDVLTRKEVLQVYEKYYKYSVRTNESGDFMIVGVPLGSQKIIMDLDLSNMGEFSLRPSDLIRMGRGVKSQFNGQLFKDSENIDSLPQIVHEIKDIDVSSFWGQDDMCDVGITRVDFDLSDQGIEILPHSTFMGSISSSNDDEYIKSSCRPKKDTGNLCDMVAGPGEILAIRQTIQEDENGNPVLEQYQLEDGGNVIDDNGAWLIDIPMNLDYITTNEFGERVISVDPTIGIPTKSKYRFKIKWQNEAGLQSQIMRANYLVPNIKEHWTGSTSPNSNYGGTWVNRNKSYSFSLNWDDYYDKDSAIKCEDTFYLFGFNKVYTTAAHIDRWKYGINRASHYGIKEILDKSCASENNKFPTNDGQRNFDFLYFLFNILLTVVTPVIVVILPIMHVLALLYPIFRVIINLVVWIINKLVYAICKVVAFLSRKLKKSDCKKETITPLSKDNPFKRLTLPMMTYPDCEACSCEDINMPPAESETLDDMDILLANNNESNLADFVSIGAYEQPIYCDPSGGIQSPCNVCYGNSDGSGVAENYNMVMFSGYDPDVELTGGGFTDPSNRWYKTPFSLSDPNPGSPVARMVYNVSLPQAVNLMNQRERYFDVLSDGTPNNMPNRMLVDVINDQLSTIGVPNTIPVTNVRNRYEDMPLIMVTDGQVDMDNGQLLSFVDPELIPDENVNNSGLTVNQYGYQSITGSMVSNPSAYVQAPNGLTYIKPDGSVQYVDMELYSPNSGMSYNFKMGVEYHQVIGSITIGDAMDVMSGAGSNYLTKSILWNYLIDKRVEFTCRQTFGTTDTQVITPLRPLDYYAEYKNLKIYFLSKGVDPYSPRQKMKFNVSRMYGQAVYSNLIPEYNFEGDYFPNIPIGPTNEASGFYAPERHYSNLVTSGTRRFNNSTAGGNTNDKLFHRPFLFTPPENSSLYEYCSSQTILLPQSPGATLGPLSLATGLPYVSGQIVKVSLNDANYIIGTVNSYVSATGQFELTVISSQNTAGNVGGLGTWCVNLMNSFKSFDTTAFAYYSSLGEQWGNNLGLAVPNVGSMGSPDGMTVTSYLSTPADPPAQGSGVRTFLSVSRGSQNILGQGRIDGASYQWTNCNPNTPINFNSTSDRGFTIAPSYWLNDDPLVLNTNTPTIEMNDETQLIFRSDRLPTSSYRDTGLDPNLRQYQDFPLMLNETFAYWNVSDNGQSNLVGGGSQNSSSDSSGGLGDFEADPDSDELPGGVLESFTCQGLVPLDCYEGEGDTFAVSNPCTKKDADRVVGGCYVFVDNPLIISLFTIDYPLLFEWRTRFRFMFGACRGVVGHMFQNSWINGTLYMPSFQKKTFYNSNNEVKRYKFCGDRSSGTGIFSADKKNCGPLYFNTDTNSFFYRSAPYYNGNFTPSKECDYGFFGGLMTEGANKGNIFQPTTIMDLGPKTDFLKEILLTPEFQGYIIDEVESTSYQDISGILNLFIISRLISSSFLEDLLGVGDAAIQKLFSRDASTGAGSSFTDSRVDGDYAQMISINSEFGVLPYLSGNYSDSISVNENLMGIWFTGSTKSLYNNIGSTVEDRRILGPGQLTFNELNPFITDDFKYPGAQEVPYYGWKYESNGNVWGSEENTWKTNNSPSLSGKYQNEEFDGFNDYPQPINGLGTGFLFNRPLGIFTNSVPPTSGSGQQASKGFRVGSPFHNYFGLKKGKSAMNLFITKYMFNADLNG